MEEGSWDEHWEIDHLDWFPPRSVNDMSISSRCLGSIAGGKFCGKPLVLH